MSVTSKVLAEQLAKESMRSGNISLILEEYNDIFSDFDPRSYSEKAMSDDFLLECRRAVRHNPFNPQGFELRLLIPKNKHNINDEVKIKQRLRNHFQKHFTENRKEIRDMRKEGMLWFALGAVFILLATYVYQMEGFIFNLLFVLLEPAGWFTFWSGLDKVFLNPRERKPDMDFYKKMASCRVNFISY